MSTSIVYAVVTTNNEEASIIEKQVGKIKERQIRSNGDLSIANVFIVEALALRSKPGIASAVFSQRPVGSKLPKGAIVVGIISDDQYTDLTGGLVDEPELLNSYHITQAEEAAGQRTLADLQILSQEG